VVKRYRDLECATNRYGPIYAGSVLQGRWQCDIAGCINKDSRILSHAVFILVVEQRDLILRHQFAFPMMR